PERWPAHSGHLCTFKISCGRSVRHACPAIDGAGETQVSQENAMKKKAKHPEEMSAAELARATRQFDQPFVFERARPMTNAERAQEGALRRRRGRPKVGKGAKK